MWTRRGAISMTNSTYKRAQCHRVDVEEIRREQPRCLLARQLQKASSHPVRRVLARYRLFAPVAALVAVLASTAFALSARRDLGAGLLPASLGPAEDAPS
jgi:hypothetical protein